MVKLQELSKGEKTHVLRVIWKLKVFWKKVLTALENDLIYHFRMRYPHRKISIIHTDVTGHAFTFRANWFSVDEAIEFVEDWASGKA